MKNTQNSRYLYFLVIPILLWMGACSAMPQSIQDALVTRTPDPIFAPLTAVARSANETQDATHLQQTADAAEISRATALSALYLAYGTQTAIPAQTQEEYSARRSAETAMVAQITLDAQIKATQQAWEVMGWTATADSALSTDTAAKYRAEATATAQAQSIADVLYTSATSTSLAYQSIRDGQMATVQAAQAEEAILAVERTRQVNSIYAALQLLAMPLLVLAGLGLTIWIIYLISRYRVIRPDSAGKMPTVLKGNVALNPGRMVAATQEIKPMPYIHPAQERVTMADIATDIARTGRLPAHALPVPAAAPQPDTRGNGRNKIDAAPWHILVAHRGASLPIGLGENGILEVNPDGIAPSLLYAGTTGAGKTRYGIRPMITAALLHGAEVVILDRSGVDFAPFEAHPNAHIIRLDDPCDAINFLEAASREIMRRENELYAYQASTLSRLPAERQALMPRIFIVIDEFSNLGDEMGNTERPELWRWARAVAARGRKSGIHLVLAVQNPTARNIDPSVSRNCTKVVFKVQDSPASLAILNSIGAERLPLRFFLTNLANELQRGLSFDPTDEEIRAALATYRGVKLVEPEFLLEAASSNLVPSNPPAKTQEIIRKYQAGDSINQICKDMFGYTGGQAYVTVKTIVDGITTTEEAPTPEGSEP